MVINEILANSDGTQTDSIELFNPTNAAIDISGYFLSDDSADLLQYQVPAGTIIAPGGYVVFDESDFNATADGFALSGSNGDEIFLSQASVGLQDSVQFGATFSGESLGRLPNGTGSLTRLASTSFGSANGDAEVGPLVISEINYNPAEPSAAALAIDPTLTDNDLEFIEIANPTSASIDLTNYRIRGEADFDFAAGTVLAAGQAIVVVTFDPTSALNANRLAAFEANYGIGANVTIVGGLSESLSNSFGRVTLQQPDTPDALGVFSHVAIDEVFYTDDAPFPDADGSGQSLQRDDFSVSGNIASNWVASTPTPGTFQVPGVASRFVFYNNSSYDNVSDSDAIATDKTALFAGQTASFANYTNYSRGINGLIIDFVGLPSTSLSATDFQFSVGNGDFTSEWTLVNATPTITVEAGAGANGTDRVFITFADNAIQNQWLEVTVRAGANTGLANDDVFYFGNAIGETGDSATAAFVNSTDEIGARNNPHASFLSPAQIDDVYDFNRDQRVNATDQLLARNNVTNFLTALRLITPDSGQELVASANNSIVAEASPVLTAVSFQAEASVAKPQSAVFPVSEQDVAVTENSNIDTLVLPADSTTSTDLLFALFAPAADSSEPDSDETESELDVDLNQPVLSTLSGAQSATGENTNEVDEYFASLGSEPYNANDDDQSS